MTINYNKLNERIVKQAYTALDQHQVAQLIRDKTERALALKEALETHARAKKAGLGKIDN